MKKNILCIVQARTGSKRFPKKVLKKIDGSTVLSLVIKRISHSKFINKERIVIATTDNKDDDKIIEIAENEGVKNFRGSEDDVLDRYYNAAKKYSADIVVRITSDCPLIDYKITDRVIKTFMDGTKIDYCSNRLEPSYPEGFDSEVFSFEALEMAREKATCSYDREHVTPYIYNSGEFKLKNISFRQDFSYLHFSLDYQNDLKFVKEIFRSLNNKRNIFSLEDILRLLRNKPELLCINQKLVYEKFLNYLIASKGLLHK